jgi:transposase-like protein
MNHDRFRQPLSSVLDNGKSLPDRKWEEKALDGRGKVQIVRRYLKDHVGLADLAEETGSTPGLILQWAKQALEGLDQTFSREMHPQRKVLHREIQEKDDRIRKLESVVSELSTENLLLKKHWGPLAGTHVAPETAEEVIKTVTHLKERAGFPIQKSLAALDLPARTFHRWASMEGKKPRPEGILPKGHWILPEEREKILAFKRQHPSVGENQVVLHDAGPRGCGRCSLHGFPNSKRSRSVQQMDPAGGKKSL